MRALALMALLACGGHTRSGAVDNRVVHAAPPKTDRLLLVTTENLYLEGALMVREPQRDIVKVTPAEFDRMPPDDVATYRAVILDRHTPAAAPPTAALYFAPSGAPRFRIRAHVENPRVVAVDDEHPVMLHVSLADAQFSSAAIFELDPARNDIALASSDRGPLIAAGTIGGHRVIACGFALTETDLVLRVAFPIFLANALTWLEAGPP